MKKLLQISGFILMTALYTTAQAQTNVNASATIVQSISVNDNGTAVNFQSLAADFTSATIDPTDAANDITVQATATAARLTVTSANLTLLVSSPANVDLTAPVSGDILDLAVELSTVTDDITTGRGGASIGTSGNVTATNNTATIWVGGTLTPKTDQLSDGYDQETYTGTVPVTVTYD